VALFLVSGDTSGRGEGAYLGFVEEFDGDADGGG
jgi:hypothetical protein